ncbi:MAG: protein BatD [Candidatus Omnitrophota bacterium]|nr:MAG: protein BatD [Candidatus Omnitrophota bacterium]
MNKLKINYLVCILLLGVSLCYADDVKFEVTTDKDKVSLGQSVKLNFSFYGLQNIPAPQAPQIENFQTRYLGPSTRVSIINGKVSSSITHTYTLLPFKTGAFTIGPFSVNYKGDVYASKPIQLEVVEGPLEELPWSLDREQEAELKDRIFLVLEVEKTNVYLNELVPLTVKLYVQNLTVRDIQYPQFKREGFSMEEFQEPRQYQQVIGRVLGGVLYDVIEFKTNIFAIKTGKFMLGEAQLSCNLIVKKERRKRQRSRAQDFFGGFFDDFFSGDAFEDFFAGYETYPLTLESAQIPMTVVDLPREGKPAEFDGAIGDFKFELEAGPQELKVGDPITLRMIIEGEGNFNTVRSPQLSSQEGFKVYDPQATLKDNKKIFEQVLIPTTENVKKIPKITFSFFNPKKENYETIAKGAIAIKVAKLEKEEGFRMVGMPGVELTPLKEEILGRDIAYIKESAGKLKRKGAYLYKNKGFLLFQAIPLLTLVVLLVTHKKRERLKTDIPYARWLHAPKKARKGFNKAKALLESNNAHAFYEVVFKTLQEYLGDKLHLPTGGITASIVDDILEPKGIAQEILKILKEIFSECDMARYAPSEFSQIQMLGSLEKLEEIINYLEEQKL